MTDNTTTIEIRLDQRDALQDRKEHSRESYKAVLDRLLADRDDQPTESDTEAIADAVADRVETPETVRLDASERRKIAEEVAGELR